MILYKIRMSESATTHMCARRAHLPQTCESTSVLAIEQEPQSEGLSQFFLSHPCSSPSLGKVTNAQRLTSPTPVNPRNKDKTTAWLTMSNPDLESCRVSLITDPVPRLRCWDFSINEMRGKGRTYKTQNISRLLGQVLRSCLCPTCSDQR